MNIEKDWGKKMKNIRKWKKVQTVICVMLGILGFLILGGCGSFDKENGHTESVANEETEDSIQIGLSVDSFIIERWIRDRDVFVTTAKELGAEVFVNMESDDQAYLLKKLSDSELRAMMDELYLDDAADLIDEMPANVVSRILAQTDPETRKALNNLLNYPEDSAGSLMTTEYVRLGQEMTVAQAFDKIDRKSVV